jgi:Zn-dependent protease with chaperone function
MLQGNKTVENSAKEQVESRKPEALKHRREMPLIWLSFLVSVGCLGIALGISVLDEAQIKAFFGDSAAPVVDYSSTVLAFLLVPLVIFFYRFYLAAKARSNAILVGPDQFPWIWALYQELGHKLDMPKLPKLYVTNGNGVVNAYALSCNKRHKYIVIHAEIALLAKTSPEVVKFVLAHELAHHKLHHVTLWRMAIGVIPNLLVPFGIAVTRAQEYSADRVALSVCTHHQGAMNLLALGCRVISIQRLGCSNVMPSTENSMLNLPISCLIMQSCQSVTRQ